LAKLTSPDSSASAASATNCRFVNPVRRSAEARWPWSTTFGAIIMLFEEVCERDSQPSHWCGTLLRQSYCASLPTNSCPKNLVILGVPQLVKLTEVMFRHEAFSPNRAILSSAAPRVLDQGDAAEVHLGRGLPAFGSGCRTGGALQRGLHR